MIPVKSTRVLEKRGLSLSDQQDPGWAIGRHGNKPMGFYVLSTTLSSQLKGVHKRRAVETGLKVKFRKHLQYSCRGPNP